MLKNKSLLLFALVISLVLSLFVGCVTTDRTQDSEPDTTTTLPDAGSTTPDAESTTPDEETTTTNEETSTTSEADTTETDTTETDTTETEPNDPPAAPARVIDDVISLSHRGDDRSVFTPAEDDVALLMEIFNAPVEWQEGNCDCIKPYRLDATATTLYFDVSDEDEVCVYDTARKVWASIQGEEAARMYAFFNRPIAHIHGADCYSPEQSDRSFDLTEEECAALLAIINKNEWQSQRALALHFFSRPYYVLRADNKALLYSATDGILEDRFSNRYIEFSEEDNLAIQNILNGLGASNAD